MEKQINNIKQEAISKIQMVSDSKNLEEIRIRFLGKKGELTSLLKMLGTLSKDERPKVGAKVNCARNEIEDAIQNASLKIKNKEMSDKFIEEKIDITLQGRLPHIGVRHPLQSIFDQIEDIFLGMGFNIAEGPEIENEYYNFEALNMPDSHPARDAQDTLYFKNNLLLRTHTSPVQIRTMEKMAPKPIRAIFPGKVFRRDTCDASHSPQFHQVEGLIIDKDVKFSDLIGVLELFLKKMFGENREIRLRPGFFPFTEPSVEVDVSCIMCGGKGCGVCKNNGWLEILGAGTVHPNVLRMGGYDPDIYTGYAFGMGVDRITMLKYRIPDIRLLYENDVRFLHQFR
ncbi:MAG: phenylalanine--tRNA ligase subunit alpha [Spirochaetes bacterium]|nr:phenylalanine--tRNA ligase subunit alpha [Spirochaetota bacterium]